MTGLRTDGRTYGRTYVRTYGHDVITKFSELHRLLPFSLTNGAPQAAFGRWSSAIISYLSDYCRAETSLLQKKV